MRPRNLALVFLLNLYILASGLECAQVAHPSEAQLRYDHWYVIRLGGTEVGYLREVLLSPFAGEAAAGPESLKTETEMHLVINRMGSRVELSSFSVIQEDQRGGLLASRFEMKFSNQITVTEALVKEGFIQLRSGAGGKSYTRTLDYQGNLFGPEGIRMMSAGGLKEIGDTVSVQTFVAEASLVTTLSRALKARETLEIAGVKTAVLKIEETLEGLPIKRTLWLDEQGSVVKQEEPGPFGIIEAIRSDRATALAALSGGELPAEMYKRSIVRANIRLPRAKPLDRLKLRLTHRNPSLSWPEMAGASQRVLEKTEKIVILEVHRPQNIKKTIFPVALTEQSRPYLEPNAYIQSDDSEIKHLALDLIGEEKDAFRAALLLERWVAENMTFDLGLVFAPATEIFKDRRGTCLGYATLLAALARAAGIPSRVVLGYVYALGMFGGHAWIEILAGEDWLPLDAAIVNEGAADAARIAFLSSSLAEGPGELGLGAAQQVFGQVDIEILEYEVDGKTHTVPSGAEPYSVEGNLYENPWLGIALEKPGDFKFTKLDAVWPDRTVVALQGPRGARVSLEQHEVYPWEDVAIGARKKLESLIPGGRDLELKIAGTSARRCLVDAKSKKAALAVWRGSEVLILRVEAADAPSLLRRVAKHLYFEN
jgi:transglutaminase-like putative cysteine protease